MVKSDDVLSALLRRDRIVVLSALAVLLAMAWLYILPLVTPTSGPSPDMASISGEKMAGLMGPHLSPWTQSHALFVFVMWTVMMVAMMIPSAAPMVLTYTMVARKAESMGRPFAASAWFVSGYLLAWALFALFATAGQWVLERTALITPMTVSTSVFMGGTVLILAGVYQWTPLKNVCLEHCRAPLLFVQRHGGFKSGAGGSLKLGLLHGVYCIGCCWALMSLLFVGGVMNVLWIAMLTALVIAEKLLPFGRWVARTTGMGAIAAGIWMLAASGAAVRL